MRNGVLPNAACDGVVDGLLCTTSDGVLPNAAGDGVVVGVRSQLASQQPRWHHQHVYPWNGRCPTCESLQPHATRADAALRSAARSEAEHTKARTVARAAAAEPR